MPSTYTTNNGLEKIGTGEQSGTWGDTTNLNFDILDQALDGLVTVTATDTGSSGSPNTLPITDGSLSDGRNRLIIITDGGDLGGSVYYQLTPADAEKIVFLRNSLSGSQDLILFQGTYNAARDLIVPAGKDVIVKFSGTGTSTAVVAPVFADLSLDAATIASADINGGTIDGVTIGVTSVATVINVDNLKLDGNTLSSTDTNGNVVLAPNGDGDVQLDADTVRVGDSNNDVTITTNGTGDLTLNTNGGTDTGSIEIQDGANTNIIITANGTGKLELANGDITTSASSGSDAAGLDLTVQAGASTGNAAGGDMVFQTTPAGAGSGTNLNSYTTVLTLTDDSKMQIGTSTAVDSILDEDDMTSDSETALATQQSIKAYVDAQVGTVDTWSEVLANGNTSGATDAVITAGQKITTDTIDETTADAGVTIDSVLLKDDVVNATDIETSTISANDGTTAINIADSTGAVDIDTSLNVDGTITGDGLTVDGDATLQTSDGTILTLGSTDTGVVAGDVYGSIHFDTADTSNTGTAGRIEVTASGSAANGVMDFYTSTASTQYNRMKINFDGNITFPEDDGTTASFVYDADAGTTFNDGQSARDFTVKSDGNAAMLYVDGTNDAVGIDISAPKAPLHIAAKVLTTGTAPQYRLNPNADDATDSDRAIFGLATADTQFFPTALSGDACLRSPTNNKLLLGTGLTERVRISDNGTVAIGTTSDQYNHASNEGIYLDPGSSSSMSCNSPVLRLNRNSTGGNDRSNLELYNNGTVRGYVGTHGAEDGIYIYSGTDINAVDIFDDEVVINNGQVDLNFRAASQNNDNMLFVDADTDRVGIGTTPSYKFHVQGPDGASGSNANVAANEFLLDNNGNTGMTVGTSNTGTGYYAFADSDVALRGGMFYDHNTEKMGFRVKSSTMIEMEYDEGVTIKSSAAFNTDDTDTSATTQTAVYSFSATNFTGAKLIVCVTDSTATERYITELLVTHDGTTAVATEYGQVATDTALATFDVDISGGNVRLLATPASSNSMTFKVMSTQLLA